MSGPHRPLEPPLVTRAGTEAVDECFLRALVESTSDAIMAFDTHGVVVLWNRACEQLFGWTADEMLGRTAEELLPQERRAEFDRVMAALLGQCEPVALETERVHRSGHVLPVSCRLTSVVDERGRVCGAFAVVRDLSRETELRGQLERARELAEARFEHSSVAQATASTSGVIEAVNPALLRLSGYQEHELLGRHLADLLDEQDRAGAQRLLAAVAAGGQPSGEHPGRLRRADGRVVETEIGLVAMRTGGTGQVVGLEATLQDVSAVAAAQRELARREARWRSLLEGSSDVAMFADRDGVLQFTTPAATLRLGYLPEEVVGADAFTFLHPDDEPGARAIWQAVVAEPDGSALFEVRVRHADGRWLWVALSVRNRLDDDEVGAMVLNLADVSDRKAGEAVLHELAGLDALTGLATRAPLMAGLDAAFASGRSATVAVAVVDLTRFKLVNDAYGSRGGDEVLNEVARRLLAGAGEGNVVARIGGDRFGLLAQDVTGVDAVADWLRGLIVQIAAPIELRGAAVSVTAAAGAAMGPAADSGALLAAAEEALQEAKSGGGDPVHVVTGQSPATVLARARLVEDLRRALVRDELVVHFQPVLSLGTGAVAGAEALVRWERPEHGLVPPGVFIDAAEGSGLIVEVGHTVLAAACRAAARWAHFGTDRDPFYVAVNLSARQLAAPGVVEVVREALRTSGAPAQALVLEVTESAVMSDVDEAVRTLQELRRLGVSIAIDDFGTGYSSLTYLKRFPVTTLKIDRSFVAGLGESSDDAAIVSSIVSLARAMGMQCIGEGVETEQQRLVLAALGCDFAQGFLWSAALPSEEFAAWAARSGSDTARGAPRHRPAPVGPEPATPAEPGVPTASTEAVARITAMHREDASLHTIAAALNAEGLLTTAGKRWTSRTVAQVLATGRPV